MARTLINLGPEDKEWLDREARARHVPMTELVRQAVRDYRTRQQSLAQPSLQAVLARTAGLWRGGRARLSAPSARRVGATRVKFLVDSVIAIDHFNGIENATRFLAEHGSACAFSVITRAEVLTGFDDTTQALALEMLDASSTPSPPCRSPVTLPTWPPNYAAPIIGNFPMPSRAPLRSSTN